MRTATILGLMAAVTGVAGCGDGPAAPPAYAATFGAGSRLKPTVLTVGGGVDSIEEWTDTQLGFRCAHRPFAEDGIAEDGVERCLPWGLGIAFSDPGCTTAIAVSEDRYAVCPLPQFARSTTTTECTRRTRVHRIVAEINPARVYWANGSEPCTGYDTATIEPAHYYSLEAMPPSAFVAINRTTRERAPGMRAEVWEGDDGSWEITGFFDQSRGEACGWHYDTADLRCVPSRKLAFGDNYFVDASCQMLAGELTVPVCEAQKPRVAFKGVGKTDGCLPKDIYEYHELVDTGTTGGGYTRWDDGTCYPLSAAPPEPPLYRVGPTISPTAFPALQPLEYGSGRLRLSYLGSGSTPFLPHWGFAGGRFFDNEEGRPCAPVLFGDGQVRCVHGLAVVFLQDGLGHFAAPDCTGERIVELDDGMGGPCGYAPKGVRMDYNQCDGSTNEVRAVSRFTGSTLSYRGEDGICSAISVADLNYSPYVLGEPLDPAALFPEIERVQRN